MNGAHSFVGHTGPLPPQSCAGNAGARGSVPDPPPRTVELADQALAELAFGLLADGEREAGMWMARAASAFRDLLTVVGAAQPESQLVIALGVFGSDPTSGCLAFAAHDPVNLVDPQLIQSLLYQTPGGESTYPMIPTLGAWSRQQLHPDAAWANSTASRARARYGLGEFVRLAARVVGARNPTILVVQVDQVAGTEWREEAIAATLKLAGPFLQRAYDLSVGRGEARRAQLLERLSPAQRPVFARLVEGLNEREVAAAIHRSPHTVHDHIKGIYSTLGISTRAELLDLWLGREATKPINRFAS